MSDAKVFAKYHAEQASYGGVSREFHLLAETHILDAAARLAEVERERDAALARLRELEAGIPAVRELRDAAVALADMVEEDAKEDVAGILGQRALQYEEAMRYAAAELRHAYRDRVINRNLVARAIEALERAMLPESYNG